MNTFIVIFRRNFRTTWGAPIWLVLSLVYPMLWMTLFGSLFAPVSIGNQEGGLSYLSFFTPGMVAATTVFGALWAGVGVVMDRESGLLSRIFLATKADSPIAAGYLLQSLIGVALQCAVILGIGRLMGADLDWSPSSLGLALAIVLTVGAALSAVSHALALVCRKQETLIAIINFLTLPVLFLSGVLFPVSDQSGWLTSLARVNPVHHGGELLRWALIPAYDTAASQHAVVILFYVLLGFGLTLLGFKSARMGN